MVWNKGKKLHYDVWNKGIKGLPPRHTTKHSAETKLKCSIAQKLRWAEGAYDNRKINPNISEILKAFKTKKGKYKKCISCDKSFYVYPSRPDGKFCCKKCQGIYMSGERSVNWKGGVTFKNPYKHKRNAAFKKWRETVFQRDEYTCQLCFESNKYLIPHHILSYTDYPDERYNIENGMTVCEECHKIIHFGKEEQIRRIYYARIS